MNVKEARVTAGLTLLILIIVGLITLLIAGAVTSDSRHHADYEKHQKELAAHCEPNKMVSNFRLENSTTDNVVCSLPDGSFTVITIHE